MNNEEMLARARQLLHADAAVTLKYTVPEPGMLYVYPDSMGGLSMVISADGETLAAGSDMSPEEHIRLFCQGERTPEEAYEDLD